VLGVLGPNGAGKTTLFKLIAGFLKPDAGEIRPHHDVWPVMGYKPERLLFPNRMKVADYLAMVARLSNIRDAVVDTTVRETLETVRLLESDSKLIGQCSKGMRQRLAVAQSLIGSPSLLLFDEPTNGLDPEGQADVQRLIRRIGARGQTVILSSHQLGEVTQTCDYLIILKQGRLHYKGAMKDALALRPHVTIRVDKDLGRASAMLASMHAEIEINEQEIVLNNDAIRLRRHVLSLLVGMGFDIVTVAQKRATLEEIYAEAVQWHNAS
jgi:ABC-2 type transport system ATP-binding protein